MKFTHEKIETNSWLMLILVLLVISVGGAVEIVPLFMQKSTTEPAPGIEPYRPIELAGRDVYLSEGCYGCHSQMIRPFRAETLRYGRFSTAGEFVYDHPFQWGSKRTGPDLARVGGRYSDEWHRLHLNNPRDVVPESNMPAYPWLNDKQIVVEQVLANMKAQQAIGVPYTEQDFVRASIDVKGKTQMDALIAYLQRLGVPQVSK